MFMYLSVVIVLLTALGGVGSSAFASFVWPSNLDYTTLRYGQNERSELVQRLQALGVDTIPHGAEAFPVDFTARREAEARVQGQLLTMLAAVEDFERNKRTGHATAHDFERFVAGFASFLVGFPDFLANPELVQRAQKPFGRIWIRVSASHLILDRAEAKLLEDLRATSPWHDEEIAIRAVKGATGSMLVGAGLHLIGAATIFYALTPIPLIIAQVRQEHRILELDERRTILTAKLQFVRALRAFSELDHAECALIVGE